MFEQVSKWRCLDGFGAMGAGVDEIMRDQRGSLGMVCVEDDVLSSNLSHQWIALWRKMCDSRLTLAP